MRAIIFAGGEGTRLSPYTQVIPKPLLPLGDTPILKVIITQLKNEGFKDIIISTGYHSDLIKTYFQNGSSLGVKIEYTTEKEKLGTAGALSLIKKEISEPFFAINGDILTLLSFKKFMEYHNACMSVLTVGIVKYKIEVPYGVINHTEDVLEGIQEKPKYFLDVGAGIYGVSPLVIEYVPKDTYMDFPTLINLLKSSGNKISCFEVEEYWKDIGILEDFDSANKDVKEWTEGQLYHVFK